MMRASLLLILVAPMSALAQTPQPVRQSAVKAAANKDDKIICRTTTEIGSLIATNKTCKTRREWNAENTQLRERGPVGNCAGGAQGGSCG